MLSIRTLPIIYKLNNEITIKLLLKTLTNHIFTKHVLEAQPLYVFNPFKVSFSRVLPIVPLSIYSKWQRLIFSTLWKLGNKLHLCKKKYCGYKIYLFCLRISFFHLWDWMKTRLHYYWSNILISVSLSTTAKGCVFRDTCHWIFDTNPLPPPKKKHFAIDC